MTEPDPSKPVESLAEPKVKKAWHNRWWAIILFIIVGLIFLDGLSEVVLDSSVEEDSSITDNSVLGLPPIIETIPLDSPVETIISDQGDFKVVYSHVTTTDNLKYEQVFKDSGLFEEAVNGLNDAIILPYDVQVVLGECGGTINAFYEPTHRLIVMCYELIDGISLDLAEVAETEEELALGIGHTLLFIFYHELGHALADIHDLPLTGREEDAVDQLSAMILIGAGGEGEEAVLRGAAWFLLRAENTDLDESAFADEHALDAQRFYNLACWVYGNNPKTHSYLVEDGYLPEERAIRCENEFTKISNSWDQILAPYLK
ncbi:MAG TPA: DUF4344 domain-containing metallopeptidase [Candidatus Nanoarchaeia archaeon]|nr:DUF4344 domain-containing metallopeptidase [Candidatus Nanoarchaeia archaeon]